MHTHTHTYLVYISFEYAHTLAGRNMVSGYMDMHLTKQELYRFFHNHHVWKCCETIERFDSVSLLGKPDFGM